MLCRCLLHRLPYQHDPANYCVRILHYIGRTISILQRWSSHYRSGWISHVIAASSTRLRLGCGGCGNHGAFRACSG